MGANDLPPSGMPPPGTAGDFLPDFAELDRYDAAVRAFAAGGIPEDRFTAIRLQQGCYGQRQPGVNMLRIKAPGGRLGADQLVAIADVVAAHSQAGKAHITTRESIQIHSIPLGETPVAMRRLAAAGLTTREACGNTVRNMTACPMAGACPKEHTDINVHLEAAARYFLRNALNQQMPRKFKISFSACESDCAQGLLHDLGVVATRKDGAPGFRLLAGGGLGHKPREAVVAAAFVPEHELIPAMEALIELHNTHSDRTKRAKSRIKFLVERFGESGFVARFEEAFARARAAHAARSHARGTWFTPGQDAAVPGPGAPRAPFAQRQRGLFAVPVSVPLGHADAIQLTGLAVLLRRYGLAEIRTTQDQNFVIRNVPADKVDLVVAGIEAIGFGLPKAGDDVVACPGTTTCRLGITASQGLAARLEGIAGDLRLRVSGCHNGCAQPETGDIGIYGEGRRLHDRLVPHYQIYLGGDGMAGGRLARKGPSVPVARIETAIERIGSAYRNEAAEERFFDWVHRQPDERFSTLLSDLTEVTADALPEVLRDVDGATDFKVAQLGGGECAGASQVFIGAAFYAAAHERRYRDAFRAQRRDADATACAQAQLRLIGQGLHDLLNPTPSFRVRRVIHDLAELAEALAGKSPESLSAPLAGFAREFGAEVPPVSLDDTFAAVDRWVDAAAEFCIARDPQLDIASALPREPVAVPVRFVKPPAGIALAAD